MAWTERYVRADAAGGGDGTTDANSGANGAWTLAEAIAAVGTGQRVNVRAGTYANTTNTRTFATAGTTTAPIWWRGFTSTAGDLDTEPTTTRVVSTDIPHFTFTTGRALVSGGYQIMSNISMLTTGASGNYVLSVTGATFKGHRLRLENQDSASGNCRAFGSNTSGGNDLSACYFKTTSAADAVLVNAPATFLGCVFEGAADGLDSGSNCVVVGCVFNNSGANGILHSVTSLLVAIGNSFYSCATDGIRFTGLPGTTAPHVLANNIFSECGGYGINNATGTNTANIHRVGNLFFNNTSGTENGFGDLPSFAQQTDSSSPFTNAGSADFSLVGTSNAKANGLPGLFENQSYKSYLDIGAVQREEPAGGGLIRHPGMSGGLNG